MTRIVAVTVTLLIVAAIIAPAASRHTPAALACTGGLSIEFAAGSSVIVLGDAVAVGDDINRAPSSTPTATFTPSATPTRTPIFPNGTPATPVSPPVVSGPPPPSGASGTPEGFSLAGYGVTLDVVRTYGGTQHELPAPHQRIEIDRETREGIEHELRQYEAGTGAISSCPIAAFVPKYTLGARYLVFAGRPGEPEYGLFTAYRARVEGGDVVLAGPSIPFGEQATLYVTHEQYRRFFDGVDANILGEDFVAIMAERVPLTSVLRYAASLNGSTVILPPDTGSAGLLDSARNDSTLP